MLLTPRLLCFVSREHADGFFWNVSRLYVIACRQCSCFVISYNRWFFTNSLGGNNITDISVIKFIFISWYVRSDRRSYGTFVWVTFISKISIKVTSTRNQHSRFRFHLSTEEADLCDVHYGDINHEYIYFFISSVKDHNIWGHVKRVWRYESEYVNKPLTCN